QPPATALIYTLSLHDALPIFDFASELHYSWLCLAVLVLVATGVHRLRSTGIGRAMIAVRDNEAAAATLSLSARRVKILAFVIAGDRKSTRLNSSHRTISYAVF